MNACKSHDNLVIHTESETLYLENKNWTNFQAIKITPLYVNLVWKMWFEMNKTYF
jgi:hypothetical protein